MQRPKNGLTRMLVAICLIAAIPAVSASGSQHEPASASTEPADGMIYGCIQGLEQILPGDYYACALRRFNHEIVPLEDAANRGGIVYLSGYSPLPENASSVVTDLHARADKDFDGLVGTVTVGALQEK